MSRNKTSKWSGLANTARGRGRLTAARLKPAAASAKPLADSSAAAVKRSLIRTRAWAAPQVDHAGHFLQDSAAPKVSAMLFSAARRLEPARRRGQRWRKLAAASAVGGAAASGVAVAARSRRKQDAKAPDQPDQPDQQDQQD
jgi:hypothetical protein